MMFVFMWFNLYVYFDMFLLIGMVGVCELEGGWFVFVIGVMMVSVVWFFGFGYGVCLLVLWFCKVVVWCVLDGVIGSMVLFFVVV